MQIKSLSILGLVLMALPARGDDWPQWMGPNRDALWAESGIIEKFGEKGPKELWRTPIGGGYAGPAVAGGKVFVADYVTKADIRKLNSPQGRPKIQGTERVLCLDASNGKVVWKHEYDCPYAVSYPAGPRCTPTVHDGFVYSLGTEGHLFCLNAESGNVVWKKEFKSDYKAKTPLWGFCGHPLVDGDKLICVVGGEEATVVAFNRKTGAEIWKALNAKEPGYCPPTIIEAGGKRQLLIWDNANLSSLNPENGELYWSVDNAPNFAMSIMAPRKSGDLLWAGGIQGKGVMLKLAADKPGATEAWRRSAARGIYPVNMTPFAENGTMYGVDASGDLMAVDMSTGERKWATFSPVTGAKKFGNGTAFIVKNTDGRYFLFNEIGELVIAKMTPEKFTEISRAKIIEPTNNSFGPRDVVWSHPAFANKCVYVRNDKEIVCYSLASE